MFCLAVPTLIYLWDIYIFPGSVCLFCCREIYGRSWEYINRSQTHKCGNWDWGRAIPIKGIHNWEFPCSVSLWKNRHKRRHVSTIFCYQMLQCSFSCMQIRVADPNHNNADLDPTFFTLMRIRILTWKWCESATTGLYRPSKDLFWAAILLNFDFSADPDRAFHFCNAD